MPPRMKPGELPKPVLQQGRLGCFPLNALTLSCLYLGHGELLLGFRDSVETLAFKQQPTLQILEGKTRRTLSLEGRVFNGYSDALYRGRLPEVMLVAPSAERISEFFKDFVEYLSRVLSMGFFIPKKYVTKRDPVEELIPCTILAGNGLLFSRFITGLMQSLNELSLDHPALDEAVRLRILGRFVRGLPVSMDGVLLDEAGTADTANGQVSLVSVPNRIRIAGGCNQTQSTIRAILQANGMMAVVENQSRNAVERLEFESALWRLSTVVFPALTERNLLSPVEMEMLAPQVENGILAIGKKRQAFDDKDNLETVKAQIKGNADKKRLKPGTVKLKPFAVTGCDADILRGLGTYAAALGMPEEQHAYERLANWIPTLSL